MGVKTALYCRLTISRTRHGTRPPFIIISRFPDPADEASTKMCMILLRPAVVQHQWKQISQLFAQIMQCFKKLRSTFLTSIWFSDILICKIVKEQNLYKKGRTVCISLAEAGQGKELQAAGSFDTRVVNELRGEFFRLPRWKQTCPTGTAG